MQFVVGAQGRVHVSSSHGRGEPLVRGAHRRDVRCGEPGHGDPRDEFVQGADHGGGVPDVGGHERGHPGVALRLALQQPLVHEPGERLPHGGPGQPEPLGELGVPHHRTGFDLPGHDGVPDRRVRPVPEQGAGHGPDGFHELKC